MAAAASHTLILGASGYLGSAYARHLQAAGGWMSCLVHNSMLPEDLAPQRVFHGSLLTFPWRKLEQEPPQSIVHFARISGPGRHGRRLAAALSALANKRLLSWIEKQAQPPRLILVAGTLAYGAAAAAIVDEDHALQPAGFARQYALGEAPILRALAAQKTPIQIMRPAWVYGPRSWLRSFYFMPMRERRVVPLYGSGDNWISLIHVEDAAALIHFLSLERVPGQTYNLICGDPIRQADLAEMLGRISGLPVKRISQEEFPGRDSGVWESLTFSQRTASRHAGLYRSHGFRHPDPQASLESLWRTFRQSTTR
jgi:nucleoside-diphosphate-sugar epimerase